VGTLVRKSLSLLVLASALALAGCLELSASLHPLFEAGQAEPVAGIEGFWVTEDGDLGLEFEAGDGGAYDLTVRSLTPHADPPEHFEARFGRLGDDLFWDLRRTDEESDLGLWPVHLPARVRLEGRSLEVAFLHPQAVELGLAHTRADGEIILLAPTDELQAFVRENGWRDELWSEALRFRKRRAPR
jgi:hypothetical protein